MTGRFTDRTEAGRLLAERLSDYTGRTDTVVLGLPRGGVPVAFEVAKTLHAPLDVFLVRKLGTPDDPELAMGAIASGDIRVLNQDVVSALQIPMEVIEQVTSAEKLELKRREKAYRGAYPAPRLSGKQVILIDDGIATGSTMRSAIRAIRMQRPARLIVAVPTVAASTYRELQHEVDEVVALMTPESFYAVGQWYADFSQTDDEEVTELLERARLEQHATG